MAALTNGGAASAPPAECPWCRVPLLEGSIFALPAGMEHSLFDEAGVLPDAVAAANAARVTANAAAAAWRAERVVAALPTGVTPAAAWEQMQAAARHTLRLALTSLAVASTVGPRQTEAALYHLRDTAAHLRGGVRSLSGLVETRRVCRAIDAIADAMMAHAADAGLARAGATALAGTGIWAARRPQRALAMALAAHAGDATTAVVLCQTTELFTRSRLSSCPQARTLGAALTTVLVNHADSVEVAPRALAALRHVVVHLTYVERLEMDAGGRLTTALTTASAAAAARIDVPSMAYANLVSDALGAARLNTAAAAAASVASKPAAGPESQDVAARGAGRALTASEAAGGAPAEAGSEPRRSKRLRTQ